MTALKPPCCLNRILDSTSVASCQIGDDHHVLDVPGRHAERSRKLPQYGVAVVEIGADQHMGVVKLARNQPAVIAPLGQPFWPGAAHTGQGLGQVSDVPYLH